jgi:ubiquitin carboxyl-terminal hydrolase 8
MNGYPNGAHGSSADTSRGSNGAGGPGGLYPSLAEIAAKASEKVDEVRQHPVCASLLCLQKPADSSQVRHILEVGKYHWNQAQVQAANRSASPASAYWEYLVAYQLVADVLPRHKDYYDKIDQSRSQMHRDFVQLAKEVRSNEERFMRIKQIILNENKRNGAAAQNVYPDAPPQHSRKTNGVAARPQDELMLPSVPTSAPTGRASPSVPLDHTSRKPPVQPKPQSLHGRAVHQSISSINGAAKTDLAERFAKLRGTTTPLETSPRSSHDLSVKMPSPSDYHSSRPSGPRDMPPPPNPTVRPPKLPLDTQLAASLPKEPSPTYSPARNLILPSNINPPRSTARSMVGTGGRSNSLAASSASSHAPNINGQPDSYFPTQPGIGEGPSTRRKSVHRPAELQITADKLYDYLRMYNVLLIDVRSRAEFDSGHIYVHNIMCIEPTSLQDGSSAEQLQDRLIISPDEEQIMYERRNEYDLVVYYDECSKTHAFLQKYNPNDKELALKRLFDTLYEFNHDKPLKRPPIFLMGGIEAWADLVGTQALKMSSTSAIVAGGHTRPRALRRTTAADRARLPLENRRRREYRPMDQEEQRKWLEEARKGRSVVEPAYDGEDEDEEATSPMYRTTEEFMRRFPDIEEQQSMTLPPSRPQPVPNHYVAPSIPQAPSRPAPSVPRVSYSGVHERQLARQSSGTHSSLYVSPGRHGLAPLHKTGLMNFGVTCYMNSVIQCLSANAALTGLFLSGRYTQDLQKNNFKGTRGILPEAYATLLSNLYKGDMCAIRPSTFRVRLSLCASQSC